MKEEIESEPVRVIAPSLLREREKKLKDEAKRKQRQENKLNGHSRTSNVGQHDGHRIPTTSGTTGSFSGHSTSSHGMSTQKYETKPNVPYHNLIRPPIIHSPLNLSKVQIKQHKYKHF